MKRHIINRIILGLAFASSFALQNCNAQPANIPSHSPIYEQTVKATDGKTFDLYYGAWNKDGYTSTYRSRAFFYIETHGKPVTFSVREQFRVIVFGNNEGVFNSFATWVPLTDQSQNITLDNKYKYAYILLRLKGHEDENIPIELIKDAICFGKESSDILFPFNNKKDKYVLDLNQPSSEFREYQIIPDGQSDCSAKLYNLFHDPLFKQRLQENDVELIMGDKNSTKPLLFTNGVIISGTPNQKCKLKIVVNSDVVFNRQDIIVPKLEALYDGCETTQYPCISIGGFETIEVTSNRKKAPNIYGGKDVLLSTNGNVYYEGVESRDGKKYYSSFLHQGLLFRLCNNVNVNNLTISDCTTECLSVSLCKNVKLTNITVDGVIGENGITVSTIPGGFAHIYKCKAYDCVDSGINIQGDSALVEKCYVERCGNFTTPLEPLFAINGSFNCGGAYSAEPVLGGYTKSHIVYKNCTAKHCANYAWYADAPGTIVESSHIEDIVCTWMPEIETISKKDFKYSRNGLRKSGCAVVTALAQKVESAIVFNNCRISSVSYLSSGNSKQDAIIYNNCSFKNYRKTNFENSFDCKITKSKMDKSFKTYINSQTK